MAWLAHGGFLIACLLNFFMNDPFKVTLPLLILHAEEDNLCDIEGSKMLFKKAKSKDKNLISFPNAAHNLVNLNWINEVLFLQLLKIHLSFLKTKKYV